WRRPWADRWLRALLAYVLPRPLLFRTALCLAAVGRPLAPLLPARLRAMLRVAPALPAPRSAVDRPQVFAAEGARRRRRALLTGCVQTAIQPAINEATIRLLTRHGVEVVVATGSGCCGALAHHLGKEAPALAAARANIAAWLAAADGDSLDAILVNASGCG